MGDSAAVRVPVDPAPGAFTYQVYLSPYSGWWQRWRGRVITRDEEGVLDIWEWQSARSRERLVEALWAEVHRDIAGRRGGAAVQLLEVTFKPG
ncbi:MAG TPA: hypothetical protein VGL44_05905 [Gaiellales bacterium]